MEMVNRKILVVGLGRSGFAAARFAAAQGADVTVTDMADEQELAEYAPGLQALGVGLELGRHGSATFEASDLIILSPGVPHTIEPVRRAKARGVAVMGEIEFAARFVRAPIVAITGTNGKTTTTELTGQMLEASGFSVFVGGNIGTPLIACAADRPAAERVVVEVSSFQLDTIRRFHPQVAVLLNISPDHLDRYADYPAYARSKFRIFKNQTRQDVSILNGRDPLVRQMAGGLKGQTLYVGGESNPAAVVDRDGIVLRARPCLPGPGAAPGSLPVGSGGSVKIAAADIRIKGPHNLENAAAAGLAALSAGADPGAVRRVLKGFGGLAHRIEHVETIDNVRFFNDSKATNVDAVARALECFSDPVILIMGGRNKDCDFSLLRPAVRGRVRDLIVLGEAGREIRDVLETACTNGAHDAATLEDAVALAGKLARSGDVVLLSPACASFDMFDNYAQRGTIFCNAVRQLK